MRRQLPPPSLTSAGYLILAAQRAVDEGRSPGPVVLFTSADKAAARSLYARGLLEDAGTAPRVTPSGLAALRAREEDAAGAGDARLREPADA